MLLFQIAGGLRVLSFFVCQFVQQFTRGSVGGPRYGLLVEAHCFHFHHFRLPSSHVHAQRPHLPRRVSPQEAFDVFPPAERNMFATTLPEHFNQSIPMPHFFLAHFLKHLRRRRIRFPQRVRKLPINPAIFLL